MTGKIKKKFQGMSPHRYKTDPLEKKFAEAWQEQNDTGTPTLDFLMDEGNHGRPNPPISQREQLVANNVRLSDVQQLVRGRLIERLAELPKYSVNTKPDEVDELKDGPDDRSVDDP